MKRLHTTLLLTLLMSMVGVKAMAYDAYIDGIWYEFYGSEAWVVNPNIDEEGTYWDGHGQYSGEVTIPSSVYYQGTYYKVTTIDDAFYLCSGLTSLKIPSSIKLITGGSTFDDCTQFSKVIINDIASWCNVELYNGYRDNPLYYAKHLYKYDGWQYVEVTDLVIPQNVSTIKHDAFSGGSSFSSITISGDVTSIGERAFYGCNSLSTVIVKNATPPSITSSSFSNIGNTTLYVPHGSKAAYQAADYWKDFGTIVDVAVDDVFTAKTKEGVDMSFKVISINPMEVQVGEGDENYFGAKAAIDKTYAGKITIPSTVTIPGTNLTFTVSQVGENAFNGCNLMTSVEIPLTIKTIAERIFDGCKSLKEVVLPNSINTIPANLALKYSEGTAIEYIHVPSSVTWIGLYAISKCNTVVIEDGNSNLELENRNADDGYYDGTLYGVKKLYVGRNTDNHSTSYAGETFRLSGSSYTELNNITFGPLVTKAFWGYDLRGCSNVTSVTCLGKDPFTSPDFYTIPQTAVLYVPLGSQQQYASADGWSQFGNITEVTEVTITMDDTEMVYAGDFDLDFSHVDGLKAYTAGDYDMATSTIILNPIQLVSAGKGVILKGAKGTYTVPCANIEPTTTDALCGTISGRFIRNTEGENVNYAFDKDEHVFKPVDAAYGSLISRNGAYLSLPASSVSGTGNITLQYKEWKVMGDADGDGFVDVADVVAMIDYILDSSTSDIVFFSADMNDDAEVDIFDVMIVINIVLNKGNSAESRTRASGNMEEQAVVTAAADGIVLGVNDAGRFTAFQFDIEVADGMELTAARLNDNTGNHELYSMNIGQNTYRVIGVSMDNSTLTASGNDLIELSFSKGGHAQISNIVFVTPQKSKVYFASGNSEVTGIGRIGYKQAEDIYALSGRKVNTDRSRLPKGLYIINNKKVVIK